MNRFSLTQRIDLAPSVAWRYLTEPPLMNLWSSAKIELLEPGDEGRPDAVGTLRSVDLGPRRGKLVEVIQTAEVPSRFVYRALKTPVLSTHRGEIAIAPSSIGSTIDWTVEFETIVPALGFVLARTLEREIGASLAKLAEVAKPIAPATPLRPFYDEADTELWSAAQRILEEQTSLADRLERDGDPKRWFSRVYQFVTENQLAWAKQRKTTHLAWVLRLIPVFHRYYVNAFEARIAGERCEAQWRTAFDAMEGKIGRRRDREDYRIGYGLLKGVRAHIEEDLPRALAEVWADHYADRCDYVRFRADYLLMTGIFEDATDRLAERMPSTMMPWYARRLPRELKELWRRRRFYDVGKARRLAFERGARFAELLRGRRLRT